MPFIKSSFWLSLAYFSAFIPFSSEFFFQFRIDFLLGSLLFFQSSPGLGFPPLLLPVTQMCFYYDIQFTLGKLTDSVSFYPGCSVLICLSSPMP